MHSMRTSMGVSRKMEHCERDVEVSRAHIDARAQSSTLEVKDSLSLSFAVAAGKLGGDLAEVGSLAVGGRERSLGAVQRIEVIHAQGHRGALRNMEHLLGAEVLHRVPGTAHRVVDAVGIAQHILVGS